jgi:hypothetical protein
MPRKANADPRGREFLNVPDLITAALHGMIGGPWMGPRQSIFTTKIA